MSLLSKKKKQQLFQFLRSPAAPKSSLKPEALSGFFFHLICTPGIAEDTFWIPAVFGGAQPDFKNSAEQANIEKTLKLFFWQSAQNPGKLYPQLGSISEWSTLDFFKTDNPLHQWSKGFVRALNISEDIWNKHLLKTDLTEYQHTAMNLGFFINQEAAARLALRQERSLDELIADILNRYPLALEALIKLGKNADKATMVEFNAERLNLNP